MLEVQHQGTGGRGGWSEEKQAAGGQEERRPATCACGGREEKALWSDCSWAPPGEVWDNSWQPNLHLHPGWYGPVGFCDNWHATWLSSSLIAVKCLEQGGQEMRGWAGVEVGGQGRGVPIVGGRAGWSRSAGQFCVCHQQNQRGRAPCQCW